MTTSKPPTPACPECDGTGMVWVDTCTCGGYGEPYYQHERYCGAEQCPNGCPFSPPNRLTVTAKDGDNR